jgi:hypothetical protein
MFGLLMLFLFIGARFVYVIIQRKEELDWRAKARRDGDSLWVDRYGTAHHVENDEPFMIVHDYKNGITVEKNPYTGKVVKNLTAEYKEKRETEAKNEALINGEKLYTTGTALDDFKYPVIKTENYKETRSVIKGRRWIDINTGETYVRRYIGNPGTAWYINIKTGLYEFPDEKCIDDGLKHWGILDGEYCSFVFTPENIQKCLNELNKSQKEAIGKDGLNSSSSGITVWHNERATK